MPVMVKAGGGFPTCLVAKANRSLSCQETLQSTFVHVQVVVYLDKKFISVFYYFFTHPNILFLIHCVFECLL